MIVVRVPASTANLGSGVDCLGMALSHYLKVKWEPSDEMSFSFQDGFVGDIPEKDNLILRAYCVVFEKASLPLVPGHFQITSEIPLSRGLGSSASALVAGVLLGNAAIGDRFSKDELIDIASALEGHPDNVVPCMVGGFTVSMPTPDHARYCKIMPPNGISVVIASPEYRLSTMKARSVLPQNVPLSDAIKQVQRVSFLVASLMEGKLEGLWEATDDVLFAPYRMPLIPGYDEVVKAARETGALCAFISGAGPSIAAFCAQGMEDKIGTAMADGFKAAGYNSDVFALTVDIKGAVIEKA